MRLTDEVVEAAALLLFNRMRIRRKMLPVYYIAANNTPECNECRDEARAALEAVLPMIRAAALEEAAKMADDDCSYEGVGIAANIRALKGAALDPDRDSSG